jgi:hypothetical protein
LHSLLWGLVLLLLVLVRIPRRPRLRLLESLLLEGLLLELLLEGGQRRLGS